MSDVFQVAGLNDDASFTLKLHRGEGMVLVAMNGKIARPPDDFVGFAIEYTHCRCATQDFTGQWLWQRVNRKDPLLSRPRSRYTAVCSAECR